MHCSRTELSATPPCSINCAWPLSVASCALSRLASPVAANRCSPKSAPQTMSIAGDELIDRQGLVLGFDVDAPNALGEQQPLDPVDVRSPLSDQPAALTVRAPQILLVDTRNAHK